MQMQLVTLYNVRWESSGEPLVLTEVHPPVQAERKVVIPPAD